MKYDFTEVRDHEELFAHDFAEHGKFKVSFGGRRPSTENPVDIQWSFTTPDRVVGEVSYKSGSYATNGGFIMIISDHLDAEPGDTGIVGIIEVQNGKPANRISMFVNDSSTDPEPDIIRDTTHGGAPHEVHRTTGLEMSKKYYGRLYRTDKRLDGRHRAMGLTTAAS